MDHIDALKQILLSREGRVQHQLAIKMRRITNWERFACVVTQCKRISDIRPKHIDELNEFCEFHEKGEAVGINVVLVVLGGFTAFCDAVSKASDQQIPIFHQLASLMSTHTSRYVDDRYYFEPSNAKAIDIKERKMLCNEILLDSLNVQLAVLESRGYSIIGGKRITVDGTKCLLSEKALVSEGGFGCVYRAYSEKHNREVAMKLSKNTAYDLTDEADNIKDVERLNCERFIKLIEIEKIQVEDTSMTVLILPWYKQGSLSAYCTPQTLLPPMQALTYYKQILEALVCLDSDRIIHRDIKPDNFLITDDLLGIVLIDFGVSREETERNTATNRIGTVRYMAPEVIHTANYNCTADCYSAGVTLYQMLTGEFPRGKGVFTTELKRLGKSLSERGLPADIIEVVCTILQSSLCDKSCRLSAKMLLSEKEICRVLTNATFKLPKAAVTKKEVTQPIQPTNKKMTKVTPPSKNWLSAWYGGLPAWMSVSKQSAKVVKVDLAMVNACGGPDNDAFCLE